MKRSEVKQQYKWKIEDIFASDEEWEKSFDKTAKSLDFAKYAGKLSDSSTLLKFLKANDEFDKNISRLAVYAHMRHDEDAAISKYTAYYAKVGALNSKYATQLSFFEPEMAQQDESYLVSLLSDKRFADYGYELKRIIARKPHTISEAEERLIGMSSEILDSFYESFSMIDNLDLRLPEIEWEGSKVNLSHGLYGIILHSENREKRKEAYEKYYSAYTSLINTITSIYYGNVKKDVFLSKVYKFNSCLERALFSEDVDRAVYDNLIKAVDKNHENAKKYFDKYGKLKRTYEALSELTVEVKQEIEHLE